MDSSDKPTVLLEYYLKKLKLATMLKEYAAVAKLCGQERTDYLIFLLRLAERESLRRAQRAAAYGVEPHELGDYYAGRTLLGREVLPEHVADAVLTLVDGRLSRTTGLIVPVDGGVASAFLR